MATQAPALEQMQSLPTSAVILDAAGTIVAVNEAWREFGKRNGLRLAHDAVGASYLQYCRSGDPHTRRFVRELKALLAGRLDLLTLIYPCHSPHEQRWFSLIGLPLSLGKPAGVALLHINLTDMLPRRAASRQPVRHARTLDAISGAVEHSVSEAIAAQLSSMFAGVSGKAARERDEAVPDVPACLDLVRARLSKRQLEVLHLLGEGKSNKEMARALLLSPNTVKLHVSAILQRLKLRSRTHAALLASSLNKQDPTDAASADLTVWTHGRVA